MTSTKEIKPNSSQPAHAPKVEFRLKLLAGNNIVLVEAVGYESEIFMPQITNGRITFQNVIPSRRCPCADATPSLPATREEQISLGQAKKPTIAKLRTINDRNRLSAGYDLITRTPPAAVSTPTRPRFNSLMNAHREYNYSHVPRSSTTNRSESMLALPSPELTNYLPAPSSSLQLLKDKFIRPVPNAMRMVPMRCESSPNTPTKVGRAIGPSPLANSYNCMQPIPTVAQMSNDSFYLPRTPENRSRETQKKNAAVQPPGTVTKWRKCITPVRTYSRRLNNGAAIMITKQSPGTKKTLRVVPTYLVNPTQCPKPTMRVEVRKRKLIVDTKKSISPQSFKRQQKSDNRSRASSPGQPLPAKRKQFEKAKTNSANTLLRTSNRGSVISPKLSQQFNKACFDRVCTTYPKYRFLCAIPPLGNDADSRSIRQRVREQEQQQAADLFPITTTTGYRLGSNLEGQDENAAPSEPKN